jgi:hypothetical protein
MWLLLAAAVPSASLSGQTTGFPKFVVPDVPDVTIKTRQTIDHPDSTVQTETVFLKHAWHRRERMLQFPSTAQTKSAAYISIVRCDERRMLELNPEARTFASWPIADPKTYEQRLRAITSGRSPVVATGANVTITIDSVDTGERRRVGRFLARHVITTTTTEVEPGANAQAGELVQHGWSRTHDGNPGLTTRVALIEFSEAPLDDVLFTIPPGYRAALRRLQGGFDLAKPDTLRNRLASYWEEVTSWAQSFWPF